MLGRFFFAANITFLWFNYFWNWNEWYWYGYFLLVFEFSAVVIFPVVIIRNLFREKKAPPIRPELLTFVSDNGKHQIQIRPEDLLYVKSEDNYVEVLFHSSGTIHCELMRTSLKSLEKQFAQSGHLLRCHRSFMVNPTKITHIHNNKRQIQLELEGNIHIPVSGKYQDAFLLDL